MPHVDADDSRNTVADLLKRVRRGRPIIVRRRGKDAAALISMADLRLLERLIAEEEDRIDLAAVEAARVAGGEPIPLEEVLRELRPHRE